MTIQAINIRQSGNDIARGAGQSESNRRQSQWYKSDAIAFGGDTSNIVFNLPGKCVVVGGFVSVETAFDASGTSAAATATLTVPNDTGTETLYDAANVGLQSSGLHPVTAFAVVNDSGGQALLLLDPGTTTVGSVRVYLEVVPLHTLL